MVTNLANVWLQIYDQIHETLRDALRRRDQIIAFYLVLLAAVISAWDKLGDTRNFVVLGAWFVGLACLTVLAQYWRWQVILHLSMVTVQTVMAGDKEPSLEDCRAIWNDVNKTNETVWSFLNPCRGVEISTIYLFSLMTFVPGYLFYRNTGAATSCLQSEVINFLLIASAYVFILALGVALLVKRSSKFNERHWMFRWLKAPPQSNSAIKNANDKDAEAQTDQTRQMRAAMDDFEITAKKWARDPNGWIAICTIGLLLIGLCALHISQDTEKRQLRAYLALDNMQSSGSGTVLNVRFNIQNFGQTPAKNCNIRGNFAILPFPLPQQHTFDIPSTPFTQNSIVPPRATNPAVVDLKPTFTKEDKDDILAVKSHRRLFVFGVLNYKDIFNESHFTNFCYFLNVDPSPRKDANGKAAKVFSWADCDQHTDFN